MQKNIKSFCKNHTGVDRKYNRYKICDGTISVGYTADIALEKKSH